MSLIILIFLVSCGQFVDSPYATNAENLQKNIENIEIIQESFVTQDFKIAFISDTHNYYDDLRDQIDFINSRNFDFVIHGGDATNLGMQREWDKFFGIIEELNIPYVVAIGNHDMLSNGTAVYQNLFSRKLNFSFLRGATLFIIHNNNNWESSREEEVPNVSFLREQLERNDYEQAILIGHVQLDDDDRYSQGQINQLKELTSNYNVPFVINGHNHNPGEGTFGKATRLTIGSSAFRKVLSFEKKGDEFIYEFLDI